MGGRLIRDRYDLSLQGTATPCPAAVPNEIHTITAMTRVAKPII